MNYRISISSFGLFCVALWGALLAQDDNEDYQDVVFRYEEHVEELVADCAVLLDFKEQRAKLNDIEARTLVGTRASELCITSPNLDASALQSLANLLIGYGTGSIPAVGPILDEIAALIVDQGFDVQRRQCYPIAEGQRVFGELTDKLAQLEEPYHSLRSHVSEQWWLIARQEDNVQALAGSGPSEQIQERLAQIREITARKKACPDF